MILRKENGVLNKKAGLGIIDNMLSKLSNHAISNNAVSTEFEKVYNELTELKEKVSKSGIKVFYGTGTATSGGLTVNISSLNLASAEDYFVIVNAYGSIWDLTNAQVYGTSHGGFGNVQITSKTATSFVLKASRNIGVSYQVVYNS